MTSPTPTPTPGLPSGSTSMNKKADQIVHRFYLKAALLLAQARESHVHPVERGDEGGGERRKADKWFNIETPDTPPPSLSAALSQYRTLSSTPPPPPPLTILCLLLIPALSPSQLLVLHPPAQSPTSSTSSESDSTPPPGPQVLTPPPRAIVLERWAIELVPLSASQSLPSPSPSPPRTPHPVPPTLPPGTIPPGAEDEPLQRVYKRGISLFRALFQLLRQLPAWQLMRRLRAAGVGERERYPGSGGRGRREDALGGLRLVLRLPGEERGVLDFDALATLVSPSPRTHTHRLSPVPTPHGQLHITCTFLSHPLFALANKESLLSATFITQDRRAASRSHRRPTPQTLPQQGAHSYEELDVEESAVYSTVGGDDGLGLADPLPPSLARFSSSPDTAARLVAQAHGGSLGSSPGSGSLSLRAQAALHASQSRSQAQPQPQPQPQAQSQSQQAQQFIQPPSSSLYASQLRRPDSPTSPTRATPAQGSPRGGYFSAFSALPSGRDLPFAVPSSSSSSPSPSLSLREKERERERKTSLLSTASGSSSVDLPLPPAGQPRRPSLNAPHPFKPSDPPSSARTGMGGSGSTAASLASSHPSHPPSPLAAYAPRQLPFPTSSGGTTSFPEAGPSPSALDPASSASASASGSGDRPPLRGTRYSSSFTHRYSSGSGSAPGTSPLPVPGVRPSGAGAGGSPSLSTSLTGAGSVGSRTSFGGREGLAGPAGAERERQGRVESVPEGEVAAGLMGESLSLGGSASPSGGSASGSGEAARGGRRYSSSFGQRRPALTGSGATSASASGSSGAPARGGSVGSASELTGARASPNLSGPSVPSGSLPQRIPSMPTPQVDDPDLATFLQMLDSGPRLSGSPGGSGFLPSHTQHTLAGSSPRPSALGRQPSDRDRQRSGTVRPALPQPRGTLDAQLRAMEARFESSLGELGSSPAAAAAGPSGISRLRQADVGSPDPFAQDDEDDDDNGFDARERPRVGRTGSDELVVGRLEQEPEEGVPIRASGRAGYARSGSRGTERAESRDAGERGERTEGRGWRRVPTE